MKYTKLLATVTLALAAMSAQAVEPVVSRTTRQQAEAINAEPVMQKILQEATSPEAQLWRFKTLVELARIASPSRYEMRRQEEITRRLTEEWGFDPKDIMTCTDGVLPGAGVQTVDGKPVYNVCVRIPGVYGQRPDAKSYKGQFPKVLLEGHIDTVNPAVLPPKETPYEPVKLQKIRDGVVTTRQELKDLTEELHFDATGHVIEDEAFKKAYQRYANLEDAKAKDGYRLYVPGYGDAMVNTVAIMQIAKLMHDHKIQPVYDIWVCGTAGEEGQGNLAGLKQLYGYNQDTGKGNNALNFVANFAADSTDPESATVHYIGSYRFEVQYQEGSGRSLRRPSALVAMTRAVNAIAKLKTAWDADPKAEKTTYTVGTVRCDEAKPGRRSKTCTLMVDMRSPTSEPLKAIRAQIEPEFAKALAAENARFGFAKDDPRNVTMKVVWFGDRPAYQRPNLNDVVVQSFYVANGMSGLDNSMIVWDTASLNDNVPAALGVPTINVNLGTVAASGGGHTWYEWGVPGDGVAEGKRLYRHILMTLTTSGLVTENKVYEPLVEPIGARTTEEMYE